MHNSDTAVKPIIGNKEIEKNSADLANRFYKRMSCSDEHAFYKEGQEVSSDKFAADCAELGVCTKVYISKQISLGFGMTYQYVGVQRYDWDKCILKV